MLEDDKLITRIFSNATQIEAIPVNGLGNVGVFMVLAGVTGANFTYEASLDGTNWFAISGLRTNNAALEAASGALSATPAYGWQFDVTCFNWFRVRATAGTFGTVTCQFAPGRNPKIVSLVNGISGVQPVSGTVNAAGPAARDSATPGNPLYIATGRSANLAGVTSGRNVDLWANLEGKLIIKDFAPAELDWQYRAAADSTPINNTTLVALVAAVATFRNYLTALQAINTNAVATELVIQDSTATPAVLFRTFLPANMTTPAGFIFPTPLRAGSGTASAINARLVTTGASVHLSAQGFAGL
jgi:hypothetical protein